MCRPGFVETWRAASLHYCTIPSGLLFRKALLYTIEYEDFSLCVADTAGKNLQPLIISIYIFLKKI